PWFWSDQYDVKLQIAGLAREYDGVVVRDGGKAVSHWYFRGSRLIAVDAMSDPRGYMIGKRLVEAGAAPDQAVIADPAGDLKGLLRA
ncbi:MAG: oxidoreductase C-terminal domain-containing protein, partial [Pseudomonadota bacterium]